MKENFSASTLSELFRAIGIELLILSYGLDSIGLDILKQNMDMEVVKEINN